MAEVLGPGDSKEVSCSSEMDTGVLDGSSDLSEDWNDRNGNTAEIRLPL